MSTLIVRPPWAAQAAWVGVRLEASSPAGNAPSLLNWTQVQELPPSRELVLAVPAALLSWHRVALPKLPPRQWRAALDTLLEERLLAEPAQVHLALGPSAQAGQEVMVAACDKAWLSQTLHALERAGHAVARIVPEVQPGPRHLHLQGQLEQGWLLDCSPFQVHCLPLSQPPHAAVQAWRKLMPSEGARLTAEPALAALAEELHGQPAQVLPTSQWLQEAAGSDWNLAQFEFSSRSSWHQRLGRQLAQALNDPAWRPARWGLAALLVLQLLGLQVWAWKENQALEQREQDIQAVLTRSFPQVKLVIDPLLQMERETALLAQGSGQASAADLAAMLAALASLPGGAVPKSLDFRNGELSLGGWQPPAGAEAQTALRRRGYQLEAVGERWLMRPTPEGGKP